MPGPQGAGVRHTEQVWARTARVVIQGAARDWPPHRVPMGVRGPCNGISHSFGSSCAGWHWGSGCSPISDKVQSHCSLRRFGAIIIQTASVCWFFVNKLCTMRMGLQASNHLGYCGYVPIYDGLRPGSPRGNHHSNCISSLVLREYVMYNQDAAPGLKPSRVL